MELVQGLSVAGAFVLAGVVKGVSGLGLPTVSLALLGLVMPPAGAAALLVLPSLATNVLQGFGRCTRRLATLLWPLWVGVMAGAVLTPLPKLTGDVATVRIGIGVLLMAYALLGLARFDMRLGLSRPAFLVLAAAAGCATGALTASTGVFILPLVPFLQALDLDKDEMVQALGLSFLVCTLALAITLGWRESVEASLGLPGLLALSSAVAGLALGSGLRRHLDPALFRTAVFLVLFTLGAATLARAVGAWA